MALVSHFIFVINRLLLLILFLNLLTLSAWAEVNIEASVKPSRVAIGEPFELSIIVSGGGGAVKQPTIPQYEHFRSYSQGHSEEISFINGKMTSRSVFTFVLIPSTSGKFILDHVQVPVGGRIYITGGLEIDVVEGPVGRTATYSGGGRRPSSTVVPPSSRTLPPEFSANQEIFVRAWVNGDEVYINQPVYLTYTIYTRASATFKGFEEEPVTTGFWVEDFPPQGLAGRYEKNIGGYRYVIADVRTVALYPTQSGRHMIEPGVLKVEVEIRKGDPFSKFNSRDIFGRRRFRPPSFFTEIEHRVLKTEPIQINVKPFPERNKPDDFNGAVGKYTLSASLDSDNVEEGEAVTYRLKFAGEGNLNTVVLPMLPAMDYFKSYDSSSSLNLKKDRLVVEGEKILDTVLVPRKEGKYTIPSLSFSYFDPKKEDYVTLRTKKIKLNVRKSTQEHLSPPPTSLTAPAGRTSVSFLGQDIRFIKADPGKLSNLEKPPIFEKSYWMILGGMSGAVFLLFILKMISERLKHDTQGTRLRRSHRIAKQKLKTAKACLKKGREGEFYETLSASVHGYFGDKLDIEPGAVGIMTIEEKLGEKISDSELKQVKDLFTDIDYGRFSTAKVTLESMKELYDRANHTISDFERKKL